MTGETRKYLTKVDVREMLRLVHRIRQETIGRGREREVRLQQTCEEAVSFILRFWHDARDNYPSDFPQTTPNPDTKDRLAKKEGS
jgi:hypothetical protein